MSQLCGCGVDHYERGRHGDDFAELESELAREQRERQQCFAKRVETCQLRPRPQAHAPLHSATAGVRQERCECESCGQTRRQTEQRTDPDAREYSANQAAPSLVTAEETFAVRQNPAEVERDPPSITGQLSDYDRRPVRRDEQCKRPYFIE